MNPYFCQVDNLKFNVGAFHKAIIADNPVQRMPNGPYWAEVLKHHRGEPMQAEFAELYKKINPNFPAFGIPHMEDSLETFGRHNSTDEFARILQYDISKDLLDKFYKFLPECISQQNIRFTYQRVVSGTFHHIHRDHDRPCTLFYLLSEPVAKTCWHTMKPESLEEFTKNNTLGMTRSIGPKYCNLEYTTVIQKNQWYMFNNSEYHSVHCLPEFDHIERTSVHLDFLDLTYQELAQILMDNGFSLTDV